MASSPSYAATPRAAFAATATANTARDGTGTLATLITGASTGTRVDDIKFQYTVTTTAGMIRIFLSLDGGTTKAMIHEIPVPANTVSATVAGFTAYLQNLGWVLPNTSAILYFSTNNANTVNGFVTRAGDL